MRLVLIEWLDSHVAIGGWKELAGFSPAAPICRSVGWLAKDDIQSKVIVPHVIDEQGDVPLQGCGDMTIPTAAIVRMIDLTRSEEILQKPTRGCSMSLHSKQGLRTKLKNKKYRDAFVTSRIAQTTALQARVLRQRKGLSQDELATALGTSQNAVSRMENPKYGKASTATLLKYAVYFDVGLIIRFAPHSEIVDWSTDLAEESVNVPDFEHDPGFTERKPS